MPSNSTLPADRLRECPAADRPRVTGEVYDQVLGGILRDHERQGRRSLTLGANDKIARFIRGAIGGGRRVLEIGCGFGVTARRVAPGQAELVGVDASQVAISAAAARLEPAGAIRYEVMDATALAFPGGRFDAAYSIDLIEHLHTEDVVRHLAEVRRVLAPGGIYVVKTPGELTGPHEGHDPGTQGFLHFREYRYGTLLPLLRAAGFRRATTPAFSMRISCRLPGTPRLPAATNLLPERIAMLAPDRSRARRFVARVLGVKQVIVVARA